MKRKTDLLRRLLVALLVVILSVGSMTACSNSKKDDDKKTEDSKDKNKSDNDSDDDDEDSDDEDSDDEDSDDEDSDDNKDDNKDSKVVVASPKTCGALKVKGTRLCDKDGNPIQLRGLSTHGIGWFPEYVNQDAFADFKGWGANVIRLAMYTAENGGYCTDGDKDGLKDLVYDGVKYATENDMYVIVDWHILSDNNPNDNIDDAKKFFKEVCGKLKDNENVIYEICNEPNGGTTWDDIKEYAEEIIPVIRKEDKDAVILVGTPQWCQKPDEAAADPLEKFDNIMYTVHFYANTHKADLRKTMKAAIKDGLPVFVSEFGICDASGNGGCNEAEADKWVKAMNDYGVSYVCWNISNKDESSAIIDSSCKKKSGFKDDDLSDEGIWLKKMLGGASDNEKGGKSNMGDADKEDGDDDDEGMKVANDQFDIKANISNTWEGNGKNYYQFDLKVKNKGDDIEGGWKIELEFSSDIKVDQSWNGKYKAKGNKLTITNVDYNEDVAKGASLNDIGFILTSDDEDLKIK